MIMMMVMMVMVLPLVRMIVEILTSFDRGLHFATIDDGHGDDDDGDGNFDAIATMMVMVMVMVMILGRQHSPALTLACILPPCSKRLFSGTWVGTYLLSWVGKVLFLVCG